MSNRRLKVVIIAPWARRLGGAEEMLWAFVRSHPRDRIALSVVFLEVGPVRLRGRVERDADLTVPAGRLRAPVRFAKTVADLARLIRRERPDVVLNWMAKTQLYGAPAARLSGVHPHIVWWQHLTPGGHWMDRLATALPAVAVGASSKASAAAQRQMRPARKVFHVHPGTDVAELSETVTRQQLGLSTTSLVVTLVGRLQPWKGQDRAIRTLAALRASGFDVQLLLVGGAAFGFDEGFQDELRTLARGLDVTDHVVLTGQVDSSAPYLAITDVALNASEAEPFGIVLLEAMALGVPVVAVNAGGPAELITDGRDGVLARDGAPESLAAAIAPLLRYPALRARIGAAGREQYLAGFTASVMSGRIADALCEVAG